MSDNEAPTKGGAKGGWTDRELLVYLVSAMEHDNYKPDYANAPVPAGRTVSGIRQKINKLHGALKPEIDALKAGEAFAAPAEGTPKKTATPRKRKAKGEDAANGDAEGSPKKRGRPKKKSEPEIESEEEINVKSEVKDDEQDLEDEV